MNTELVSQRISPLPAIAGVDRAVVPGIVNALAIEII